MRVKLTVKDSRFNLNMPKNWKTTSTAAISAAASFVLFSQELHYIQFPQWAMAIAMFAMAGGLASFGISAKDFNTTGGTVGQPSTPEALHMANQAPSVTNPPVPPIVAPVIPPVAPEAK